MAGVLADCENAVPATAKKTNNSRPGRAIRIRVLDFIVIPFLSRLRPIMTHLGPACLIASGQAVDTSQQPWYNVVSQAQQPRSTKRERGRMPIYKESAFPPEYRRAEAGQILGAVYRLRSIAVTGLAGMGKSSVVRFCVGHREAQALHLAGRAAATAFVHVDCVGLACGDEDEVLAEILAQLQRERLVPPVSPGPNGAARRRLKDAILALDPGLHLVVALDELDQAAAHQSRPFYNYLAHLRNSRPRGNLSYILAGRRLLGPLYELQELLDDPCSIGPLAHADALESLRRDEQRLGFAFDDAQREALVVITGGHPGFLKTAAELVASGRADTAQPAAGLARQMLASNKMASLADELWRDLAEGEQATAAKIAQGLPLDPTSDAAGALM
ncbi:MAG: ATP-binding protein, partial [Chloroflexi bacterium]